MANKAQIYKNLTCLSFCLVMVFITSIFVSETYYNRIINEQIGQVSILKSIHYEDWALRSAPSAVIHKFQPYVYDQKGQFALLNQTTKYQYTYEYKNISFSQGNTGNIRYLNNWKRELVPTAQINQHENEQKQINTISNQAKTYNFLNVDAEKVYNYDYFAPDTRRFALSYNIISNMISKQFIPNFYGYYMFEFIFNNATLVQSRLFDPLGIAKQQGQSIYSNSLYGFNNPLNIGSWLKLGDDISSGSYYSSPFYKGVRQDLNLNQVQILYLAGQKSTLQNLLTAIKSAIKYKLQQVDSDLCSDDDFCSIQELVSSQIGLGFLTKQPIFTSTNINKLVNQLNTTVYDILEYKQFCKSRPDLDCAEDIDAMNFFSKNYLSNYTQVDYVFRNFQNPKAIEEKYDINNTGQMMIEYVKHLYSNVFNLAKVTINQQDNQYDSLQEKNLNVEAFKRSFTNYNHIEPILSRFRELLYVELHTRAFYNKFIVTDKTKCLDYYQGDFEKFKGDCQKITLNSTNDVRIYMKAYLGIDTLQIAKLTTMNSKTLFEFLHSQNSLFAQQTKVLEQDLKTQYNCTFTCNYHELMINQWKDGSILTNLPKLYFTNTKQSILNWDQKGILKNVEPQIFKFVNVPVDFNAGQVLNNIFGIYSLFNLMKVYNQPQGELYKGLFNSDLLFYIQSLVLQVDFSGIYMKKTTNQFFNGYQSEFINQKRHMDDKLGGASWLDSKISVIKLENKPQKFNFINSGIYDSDRLRSISLIQDSLYSSSQYQIFKSQYDDVSTVYKSNKKIKGTNLFGFQTKIQQFDSIQGYFQMIYQSKALSYKNSLVWKTLKNEQIDAFKFEFQKTEQFQIDVQQLANRTVQLSADSYFIVEPQTGITLQKYIKYTVYSKPFYLSYLTRNPKSTLPLYQGQIYYVNDNTDHIVQLNKDMNTLNLLFLLGIIFSSISIVAFVILLVLYKRATKSGKQKDENKSLLTGAEKSLITGGDNSMVSSTLE